MRIGHAEVAHTIDAPAHRFVLVHYHIFKNGGTTIESILRREFGDGFASLHGAEGSSLLDSTSLVKFLGEHPGVQAVSSHHLQYPKPEVPGWVIFDCCFLRHPFDRLVSVYHQFGRANPARRESLREFVKHMIDETPHLVSDVQVNRLANGGAFTRPAGVRDLERAEELVCRMAVPGVVDLFDESLVSAEYFLKPAFPDIRLHYEPQNVTQSERTRIPGNAIRGGEAFGQLWGEDVQADLLQLNQLDLALWRSAGAEVLRRFGMVPRAQQRLANFRAVNARAEEPGSSSGESAGGTMAASSGN